MDDTPDAAPAAAEGGVAARSGVLGRRWIAEAVLILASVAVGFLASEFGQYRDERGLADAVLRGVREEVEANEATLTTLVAKHRQWHKSLANTGQGSANRSPIEILVDARPDGNAAIGLPLKRAAWQMAISSGALRLLDHEVASALSEIYSYQDLMTDHHNRFVSATLYTRRRSSDPRATRRYGCYAACSARLPPTKTGYSSCITNTCRYCAARRANKTTRTANRARLPVTVLTQTRGSSRTRP